MAGDFTRQAETALRLIARNGQDIVFTRETTPFDPVTGGPGVATAPVTFQGKAVRLPNFKGTVFEGMDSAFKAALVTGKATVLLVAAKGLEHEPIPGDSVTLVDGSIWATIGLTVLNPAGLPIIYTMGVLLK